ncbi:MAG: cystathionine beta-synthase [Cytophagales bacterium]|nr:cystathionine beta-synthase [Cytophagales bacterium]
MYYQSIIEAIGHTPLIQLNRVTKGIRGKVLVKVEYFNPGNSMKDRIGLKMIEDAERTGLLKPGGTIIEGTSGNTGMGLALVAIAKGYKCIFTLNDKQSKEKMDVLRAMGAQVVVCPTNVAPHDPRSYYSVAKRLNQEIPNSFYPNQYDNLSNRAAHYETTGPEIWEQTEGKVTHYAAGVGTGGSMCGTAQFLKEKNPQLRTVGIDSYGSVFKKYKETGVFDEKEIYPYLTEGIGEDILPKNVEFDLIDTFVKVTDKDSALMTRRLAREEGLFVGWSCGAAVFGALEYAKNHLKEDDMMVVILPDHGSRYLAKVYNDEWMRNHGFLERQYETARSIIQAGRRHDALIQIDQDELVSQAVAIMSEKGVSQLPVSHGDEVVGSLVDSQLLRKLIDEPDLKSKKVKEVMGEPFQMVAEDTSIDVLSTLLTKDNPALMVRDEAGQLHIITQQDLLLGMMH